MNFETFEKKLEKFKINNPELIEDYEAKLNDSIDDYTYDLYQMFDKLSKVQTGIDPIIVLTDVIQEAVRSNNRVLDCFDSVIARVMIGDGGKSSLQRYFKEISRVYDKNDNNYDIVYCPENVDKLIEMNLKTVISIAKGYQGLGLSLEELISAGNVGLVICAKGDEKTHIPKYNPEKAKLKDDMLNAIEQLPDDASEQQIIESMQQFLVYGDVKKKFSKAFGNVEKTTTENDDENDLFEPQASDIKILSWNKFAKQDVVKWIKHNVKNATFNSVAFMWIRAFILIEIDNNSRLVKKPKSEIYNDKIKYGAYRKEVTLDIDAPVNDDGSTCFGDILQIEDDTVNDLEISEAYDTYKDGLNKLLDGVKARDRSVFLKKFGIGLPRPMLPKEIAEQENLSIARISQIFQSVVEQMQKNQVKYNIDPDVLFEAARKLD